MENNIFAADALDLTSLPSDQETRSITLLAQDLIAVNTRITILKDQLEYAENERKQLAHYLLPDAFDSIGTDRIGVPGANVDIIVVPYYHANILTGDTDPDPTPAFDHLEYLGGGDILKTTVSITFGRGDLRIARDLIAHITNWNGWPSKDRPITLRRGTPWNTLTAWLREYLTDTSDGRPLPNLPLLGATVGRVCKIVARKTAKGKPR